METAQAQQREELILVSKLEKGLTIRGATKENEIIVNKSGCYVTTVMQHVKDAIQEVHYSVTVSKGINQLHLHTPIPILRGNDVYDAYERLINGGTA